jgi:hypothetical protein
VLNLLGRRIEVLKISRQIDEQARRVNMTMRMPSLRKASKIP